MERTKVRSERLQWLLDNLILAVEIKSEVPYKDGIDEDMKKLFSVQQDNIIAELRQKIFELL